MKITEHVYLEERVYLEITEKQYKSKIRFETSHHKHKHDTAIGGQFTYCITSTGLGNIYVIKCNACGKEKDITDYKNW